MKAGWLSALARTGLFLGYAAIFGCSGGTSPSNPGPADAGTSDSATVDSGSGGAVDSGVVDSSIDSGLPDSTVDSSPPMPLVDPDCLRYAIDAGSEAGGDAGAAAPEAGTTTTETQVDKGVTYTCQDVVENAQQDFSDLPAIAANQGSLLPGLVYSDNSLQRGQLEELAIPRSGGQYYINLDIPNPSVTVSQITSVSAQQAVAGLTLAASNVFDVDGGPSLPAQVGSSISTVYTFTQ
jgi:hypothetical protein